LGELLSREHEVTVIDAATVDLALAPPIAFSCPQHRRSVAVLAAIEAAFGERPPDYLEVPDFQGIGLVALQARDAGHRSLRGTTTAVRIHGSHELACLHDGSWTVPGNRILCDFERESVRLADTVIWPGGEALEHYRRSVDPVAIGSARRIAMPLSGESGAAAPPQPRSPEQPLQVLFAGPLQRSYGALALVEACLGLEREDWCLTLAGEDTETAPLEQSVAATIETICADDERVELLTPFPWERFGELLGRPDLLVVPSSFDAWSPVALEAMRHGVPVLATAVGGLTEIVADGVSGWHCEGAEAAALRGSLTRLLDDRAELERVRASGEVERRCERLVDPEPILAAYRDLLGERSAPAVFPASTEPLVSAIVPYFGESELLVVAVESLLAQTHRALEVVVVDDGSFEVEDRVLEELDALERVRVLFQANGGEGSARNLAIADTDGKYLAFLDSDNSFEPEFVERAVAMLEADPELAYVTCWLRFLEGGGGALSRMGTEGYAPLGNAVRSDESINSDGDAIAVMPRRLFSELGFEFEPSSALLGDWALYRSLRDHGRFGKVIPEQLARYLIRAGSISRTYSDVGHIAWGEAVSRRRAKRMAWTASA
jgi:glycosyltransferase involved in cell wall biosynthesis